MRDYNVSDTICSDRVSVIPSASMQKTPAKISGGGVEGCRKLTHTRIREIVHVGDDRPGVPRISPGGPDRIDEDDDGDYVEKENEGG